MAEQSPPSPPKTTAAMADSNSNQSQPENNPSTLQPDPTLPLQSSTSPPNLNPLPIVSQPSPSLIAPPSLQSYASPGGGVVPPSVPYFRPATQPVLHFSTFPPNPSLQTAVSYPTPTPVGVPPPGVMLPTPPGQVPLPSSVPPVGVPTMTYAQPGQPIRAHYAPMPNGYPGIPQAAPGSFPPPGILRYPTSFAPIIRPAYTQRSVGAVGVIPPLPRPPFAGLRAPIVPPVVRPPVVPNVTSTEKQTTVYVGKIASSVENEFMLALLQLCGPVKSWKRPQNPTNGTFKGFGLCEFESAEGVLRALRLLSKLNIDGQELMLNVNQATREYLEQKKVESLKNPKEVGTETESNKMDEGIVSGDKKNEPPQPSVELPKPAMEESGKDGNETVNKENSDDSTFGLVTDEDRQADREALEKLTSMMEERSKNKPLPPPPSLTAADGSSNSNLEGLTRSKDGEMDVDAKETAEDKNENEMTSESKPSGEQDRSETSSPDRDRRHDRRGRDRERDMKREKERELERYEREREQERAKREKEREYRLRDDERRFKAREKEWESREKEKEHWRQREKEREKERLKGRKEEIIAQERDSDGGYSKKRKYRSSDEERRRRQREKEEDLADRFREEEEVAEAERRAEEEQKRKQKEEELKFSSTNGSSGSVLPEENNLGSNDKSIEQHASDHYIGDGDLQNGIGDEIVMTSLPGADVRQNISAPAKKLGFGLQGSGKRTTVPSVFNQDEDDDLQKEKKMRPLVPIDYSTEEQLVVQSSMSEVQPSNLVAATELGRRVSSVTPKDERPDKEKERSKRSHDRGSMRDRDRSSDDVTRNRDENRKESMDHDKVREPGVDKAKTIDNQKLLDAKQLIDMIPKTKEELFSYEINWATYDKNQLHERMKPWISKKITEFLGEEEPTLVDYVMSSTREHVAAAEMLNRLQGILDEEAEMFVLKMWRMLIFEIKRVETGLALRSRA